jgi:hypothetical protein
MGSCPAPSFAVLLCHDDGVREMGRLFAQAACSRLIRIRPTLRRMTERFADSRWMDSTTVCAWFRLRSKNLTKCEALHTFRRGAVIRSCATSHRFGCSPVMWRE